MESPQGVGQKVLDRLGERCWWSAVCKKIPVYSFDYVSGVTGYVKLSHDYVLDTRNRLQSQVESEGKIMQRGTSTELTIEKIKAFEKDHWEIGRREEYYDSERLAVIKQTFNRIYSNCLQDGLPESFGLISALQAMIDAGYRAGKRAERARRKTQAA